MLPATGTELALDVNSIWWTKNVNCIILPADNNGLFDLAARAGLDLPTGQTADILCSIIALFLMGSRH